MKDLKTFVCETIHEKYTGNHAIHELCLLMDNDRRFQSIVSSLFDAVYDYQKQHPESDMDKLMKDMEKYAMAVVTNIVNSTSYITLSNSEKKEACKYVLQAVLNDIDDQYAMHPGSYKSDEYSVSDLNW